MILKSRKFTTQRNLAVVVAARSKLHVKTHKTPKQTCKKLWNLQKTGTNYMSKHANSKNRHVKNSGICKKQEQITCQNMQTPKTDM